MGFLEDFVRSAGAVVDAGLVAWVAVRSVGSRASGVEQAGTHGSPSKQVRTRTRMPLFMASFLSLEADVACGLDYTHANHPRDQ